LGHGKQTHLNWRKKKMQKPKKKKKNPNKAASRIDDLHEHWLVDNATAKETPTAVTLRGHPRIVRSTSRKL
jgi:hypothetical protein